MAADRYDEAYQGTNSGQDAYHHQILTDSDTNISTAQVSGQSSGVASAQRVHISVGQLAVSATKKSEARLFALLLGTLGKGRWNDGAILIDPVQHRFSAILNGTL